MAELHFNEYPLSRDLFNVSEKDVKGRFSNWKTNANYTVKTTVVLQIDTTNVSAAEQQVAPNITFITTNQAIINIYRVWTATSLSFSEFQNAYALREAALERYVEHLLGRLNTTRRKHGGVHGDWFVNYSLNDRVIEVRETSASGAKE